MTDVKADKPASDERLNAMKSTILDLAIQSAIGFDLNSQDALPFVRTLVKDWYTISDDGEILANDKTPFDDNMKPLPIENVGVSLRTNHPYLFKSEQSAKKDAPTPKPVQLARSEMTVEQKARYVQRYGKNAFLALPATPTEAIPTELKRRSQMSVGERVAVINAKGQAYYLSLPA